MKLWRSRALAIAVVVVAPAGGGAAYATSQEASGPSAKATEQPFLGDVADRVGVAPERLLAAFKAEAKERVDAAVSAGKLKAEAAARIKARIDAATLAHPFAGGPGRHGGGLHGRGGPPAHGPLRGVVRAAAEYVGVGVGQLLRILHSGKSLAEAATERGKTVTGLEQAILASVEARLDRAGRLSAEQKERLLDALRSRLDEIVNRKRPAK